MITYILQDRKFLFLLFLINLVGTIYGFVWYQPQLVITPALYWPFVPDSPTATLFFTIALFFLLIRKHAPYMEALAVVSLFKYGVWAVVMNLLMLYMDGTLNGIGYMLILSHGAMAVQGLLYTRFYRIQLRHLMVAAIWVLHNDIIDYVFGMMPIYSTLTTYMQEIGYFTFWLSIFSILLVYGLLRHNQSATMNPKLL